MLCFGYITVNTQYTGDKCNDNNKSAYVILAKEQYITRHDRVCAQLHFSIFKETAVQLDKKQWYELLHSLFRASL